MDKIIGMMFCKNEGDIIEQTIEAAVKKVDELYISDDGSTDRSWEIIQSCASRLSNLVHVQQEPNKKDPGQRNSLITKIRKRNNPERVWVQNIEADVQLISDPKYAIENYARHDMAVTWTFLNAVRQPGTWKEVDTFPNWEKPIAEIMPFFHYMEMLVYTFRPLPKLYYDPQRWAPAPRGWTHYVGNQKVKDSEVGVGSPILAHYGYRGPTHFYNKFKNHSSNVKGFHKKYLSWNLGSIDEVENTVSFFNGHWNNPKAIFPISKEGWKSYMRS